MTAITGPMPALAADRLSALKLPDGRRAAQLRRRPLYEALASLGVPGVHVNAAHQELLEAYSALLHPSHGDLRLPDGRDPNTLRAFELRAALHDLGVDDFKASATKGELLAALARYLADAREKPSNQQKMEKENV